MDSLPPTAYAAIGAIAAAMISGLWSLVTLIISKDQKVSDFRQAWIDSLRQEVADYIGQVVALKTSWQVISRPGHTEEAAGKFLSSNLERITAMEAQRIRVFLRLNPREHVDMLSALEDIARMTSSPKDLNGKVHLEACDKLERETQRILKQEWTRVKSGERSFRYLRNSAAAVVAISAVAFLVRLYA
jgi:hypothetical protein